MFEFKSSPERASHITYRWSKTFATASGEPLCSGLQTHSSRPGQVRAKKRTQKSSKLLKCWYNEPFFPGRGVAHPLRPACNSLPNSCRFYHYERYSNLSWDSRLKKNGAEWSEISRNSHMRSEKRWESHLKGIKKWAIRVCAITPGLLKQIQAC